MSWRPVSANASPWHGPWPPSAPYCSAERPPPSPGRSASSASSSRTPRRLLVGVDHRWLLPLSTVLGAILLTAADVVGRIVARPSEIDVGIVTALIGAPFFIYIVRRQKVRAL